MNLRYRLTGVVISSICLLPLPAFSQISESEILSLIAAHEVKTARARVREAHQQNPNTAVTAYYNAVLEEDADVAAALYQGFVDKFRSSSYATQASYRLGQYYFARGSYVRSRQIFLELAKSEASTLGGEARYFAAKSLMASGDLAQAKAELQEIVQNFTGTWIANFASADLAHSTMATLEASPKTERREREARYAVQVGAFSARENAGEEEKKFSKAGYKTEVRERQEGHRKSYLVWVGEFHDRDQARDFADELQKKFKTRYHVVRRND